MAYTTTRYTPQILLVEDSRATLMLLSAILKVCGNILISIDGLTALQIAQEKQPDLIILDIEIRDVCGFDICKALKHDPLTRDIPVIFITKFHHPQEEITALRCGAVDFITKPFNATVVKTRVSMQLNLKKQIDLLREQACLDCLTGVYNRRALNSDLDTEIRRHARALQPLGLLLLDVDYFKYYNDFYGHLEGDACLQRLSALLKSTARRAAERIYRYGGEEFVIILPNTDEHEIRYFAESLCLKIRQQNWVHNMPLVPSKIITISIGIVSLIPNNETSYLLLSRVDKALYQAKKLGRNQVQYWQDN